MRVLALHLPDLACELATLRRESQAGLSHALSLRAPLAVVLAVPGGPELSVGSGGEEPELTAKSVLFAVTERARRLGVHVGQSVASARALSSDLDVRVVTPSELEGALGRIAESMFTLSPTVSVQGPDTVLLDVTGGAGLSLGVGGSAAARGREEVLLDEACERVRALGHRVRGAIADGVHTARAVARFAPIPRVVVPAGNDEKALGPLPVAALPVSDEVRSFFGRLGLFTIEDVKKQPLSSLAVRLGDNAPLIIELLHGRDRTPLVPYEAPRTILEELSWDEPVAGSEALLFVLRGLLGRVAARLVGRGEATTRLVVRLGLDKGMLRCRQAEQREKNPESLGEPAPELEAIQELSFVFPVPIAQANELLRAVHTRVERLTLADTAGDARLAAPVLSLAVIADKIVPAARVQLDLSRDTTVSAEALPVLLAELAADLGDDKLGKLSIEPSQLIEERSRLVPFLPDPAAKRALAKKVKQLSLLEEDEDFIAPPTRLLRSPLPVVGNLTVGSFVTLVREKPRAAKGSARREGGPRGAGGAEKVAIPASFTVKRVQITERIEDAVWWTGKPRSRDYAVAYLDGDSGEARGVGVGAGGGVEALVVRDRRTGKIAVHGFY
jgi:protein ImuB